MTREEAIARIKNHKIVHKMDEPRAIYISEALDMAIEALEQEPRKGHWILGGYDDYYYICDKCNYKASEYYFKPRYNFCPNCGARMIEPQKSEDDNG